MRSDLILWRHAEAVDLLEASDDLARALTTKGERQAQHMAAWLSHQLPAGTRVMASPARRAQQTASALDRSVETVAALDPAGSIEGLLGAVRWPATREPVLVVGHQPTLGMAACYLLTGSAMRWPLRKGAIVWLRGREREGVLQVQLHAALGVDLL